MAIDYSKMSVYGDTYGNTQEDLDATQQDQETGIAEILIPNINTPYLNSGNNNQYYNNNQLTALRDNALATRQKNLNDPGKIQGIINSGMEMLGMTPQRSVEQMILSGQKDVRKTSGIPFGIGTMLAKAMPDSYYDKMTLADQIFTQSQMTNKALPTVFDSGNTMVNKDEFGINKRSMFGNYGEYGKQTAIDLAEQLEKSKDKHIKEYGNLNKVNKYGKTWSQMNKINLNMLNKYNTFKYQYSNINDKINLAKKAQDIKEKKIAKEAQEKIEKEFNERVAAETATANRARAANAAVYASADAQNFTNAQGGFSTSAADRAGTSAGSGQFSPSSSRGRSGYGTGGIVTL
jgi:hypothetical protein